MLNYLDEDTINALIFALRVVAVAFLIAAVVAVASWLTILAGVVAVADALASLIREIPVKP